MSFDFVKHREQENIYPIKLIGKEKFHSDLFNIHQSWTGRIDARFSNDFFRESIQLIINCMALFEQGYFDCAFYSLRQSLEIATTIVYFVDDNHENRSKQIAKWKNQERFPLHKQMINELNQRRKEFSDIKNKMSTYFDNLESTKQKLNKYVHKQGVDKFYIYQNSPMIGKTEDWRDKLITNFITYLKVSIGAVATLRLVIDPFPVLLADEKIYKRTGEFVTEGYTLDFIEEYIGLEHIKSYKKTNMYTAYYDHFIGNEEMLPPVLDVVKHNFIDRTKREEILSQKHLLSQIDLVAIDFILFSEKISKVHGIGGFYYYFSNIKTIRNKNSWSSQDFNDLKGSGPKFNRPYDEAFLSFVEINNESYYLEHNEAFSVKEIEEIVDLCLRNQKI